jgi:cytochrome c6
MIKNKYLMKYFSVLILALSALPAAAADINKGGQLYGLHCANCHGASGVPVMPGAPNFQRSEKLLQPDNLVLAAIRRGRNAMPAYVGILRDQEIIDVVGYLRTLQR